MLSRKTSLVRSRQVVFSCAEKARESSPSSEKTGRMEKDFYFRANDCINDDYV